MSRWKILSKFDKGRTVTAGGLSQSVLQNLQLVRVYLLYLVSMTRFSRTERWWKNRCFPTRWWRRCDALGHVLLRNLALCHLCRCLFYTYNLPHHLSTGRIGPVTKLKMVQDCLHQLLLSVVGQTRLIHGKGTPCCCKYHSWLFIFRHIRPIFLSALF